MAWVKSGVVFPERRSTTSVLHSRPQLLPSPNSHKYAGQYAWFLAYFSQLTLGTFSTCAFPFSPWPSTYTTVNPVSAPFPNLQAPAEKTKNQLSNACLRSRIGGVVAETCLRKVKWDYMAGRGWVFQGGELSFGFDSLGNQLAACEHSKRYH